MAAAAAPNVRRGVASWQPDEKPARAAIVADDDTASLSQVSSSRTSSSRPTGDTSQSGSTGTSSYTTDEPVQDEEQEYDDDEPADDEEDFDEEEEGEELDDGTDDDQELQLKYDSWKNDGLRDQDISCVCVGEKTIVLGTGRGSLIALDSTGAGSFNSAATLKNHEHTVNDVALDFACDFVASVDMGGSIMVQDFDGTETLAFSRDRPMTCVAIHPRYKFQDDRPIIFGGHEGKVIISTKGMFFGNRSQAILDDKCGNIFSIKWHGDYVAWATERDVVICHAGTKTKFYRLPRPAAAPRPEFYRCTLIWETDDRLLVGWATMIRAIKVHPRSLATLEFRGELDCSFDTDLRRTDNYRILGAAPFDDTHLLLLTCMAAENAAEEGLVQELDMRIVSRATGKGMADPDMFLSMGEARNARNFLFFPSSAPTIVETHYFVASPIKLIKVTRANNDDKVDEFIKAGNYRRAWEYARQHQCVKFKVEQLGKTMLEDLFAQEKYDECARLVGDVVGTEGSDAVKQWDEWVRIFVSQNPCPALFLLPYVPRISDDGNVPPSVRLSAVSYDLLLNRALLLHLPTFREYVKKFKGLYDCPPVCNSAKQRLAKLKLDRDDRMRVDESMFGILGECIGLLLEFSGKHEEALDVLLEVRDSEELFAFIERHRTYDKAMELLDKLFAKNQPRTLELLMKQRSDDEVGSHAFPPDQVVRKLETRSPALLWEYVKLLRQRYPRDFEETVRRFSVLLTSLYITQEPSSVYDYLKEYSQLINLKDAYNQCRRRGLMEESVFVMAKMGYREDGLKVLICDMKNVVKAIQFIRDHFPDDEDHDQLFKKLVDLVLETDKALNGSGSNKYCEHQVADTDTWQSIARRYGIDLEELMLFNSKPVLPDRVPLPRPTLNVPLRMVARLLKEVSDPTIGNSVTIHLIRAMPDTTKMLAFADGLSAIARSKTASANFTKTLISVFERDVYDLHVKYHRTRSRAVRIKLPVDCDECLEPVTSSDIVSFRCQHNFHPACHFNALRDNGILRHEGGADSKVLEQFYLHPNTLPPAKPRKAYPGCSWCTQDEESN